MSQTRLSSIESQPKKVVVVVVGVVVVVVVVVFAVIIIVGQKNLTLKLGQNWVNKGSIVIVISLFYFCCCSWSQNWALTWSDSGHQ